MVYRNIEPRQAFPFVAIGSCDELLLAMESGFKIPELNRRLRHQAVAFAECSMAIPMQR